MKVLITGGAGYIGSVLTRYFLWDFMGYVPCYHKVGVVDSLIYGGETLLCLTGPSSRFKRTFVDIRSIECKEVLEDFRPDAVVHLAALVGEPCCTTVPDGEAWSVNTHVVARLLRLCADAQVSHLIFASTCSAYGKADGLLSESAELKPLSLYARTKVDAEYAVLEADTENLSTTVLRFATAYGLSPRMRFDTLLNQFALEAWRDRKLEIYNPSAWRPLVHVRDIARAVSLVLSKREEAAGQIYNVGGHNVTKIDLAMALKDLIPNLEIVTKETGPDARDYRVNFGKILKLGFRPMYHPADGLREVVEALEQGVFLNPGDERWRNA